jgi:hypothetical protein
MMSPRIAFLVTLGLLFGASATTVARQRPADPSSQTRPMQADAVLRLLTDLESAARRNDTDEFRRLTSPVLAPLDRDAFVMGAFGPDVTSAAIRERDRQPAGAGALVLVEMLIGRGRVGRISTWQLLILPTGPGPTDPHTIAGITPVASVDGLVQLELDTTQQFEAKDLVLTAPGLWVRLTSGVVFLAKVDAGPTALVFRGKGVMRFAPDDPAEQVQVRAFSGKPVVENEIEAAYFRVNPAEFADRFPQAQLVPVTPHPGDIARAQQLFGDYSRRSFTLNLDDLTTERWSLLPPVGDTLAELRTRRFGSLTYVRAGDDAEDVSLFDRQRGRNISVYASPERLGTRGRFYSEDAAVPYDVEHYAVDVRLDPEREWISGRGSMRLRTKVDGLSTLSLKLAESLAVTSVSSPEFGRVLALRVAGQSGVIVSLPQAVARGTTFVLDVYYSGRLPAQQVDREAILVEADAPPQAQPNPAGQQDLVVLPEPRFLYSNRTYWYPQAPVTDFATAALQVTVPAPFQVVGTGTLINNTVAPVAEGGRRTSDARAERTVQFLADRPIRYSALIVSRFVPVGSVTPTVPAVAPDLLNGGRANDTLAASQVTVDVVATPRLARANRTLPDRVADMVGYYASVIGEAPYPNFTLATLDAEIPSGHSPGYFAIWNQATLPTTLTWRGDPVALNGHPFFFLAHEVAHQWFGQAIGWKNYHEQWLSEGLAQYFAARYAGSDRGPDIERQLFAQMRESAMDLSRHGPVHLGYRLGHVQNDGRIFRGLVYNKAAVVLHMLRRMIGPDAFDRGVRLFYATHRFQKAGTDDIRVAFEAEAQVPLDRFFDRWILGFTLPEVEISWRMDPDGRHAVIRIEQTPGDVFDFPLTLTMDYGPGMTEQVAVIVNDAAHEVRIPVPTPPRRIDTRDDLGLVVVRR